MVLDNSTSINEYLIYLRKSNNLSLKELSKLIKINRITLFNLERGYRKLNSKLKEKYIKYFYLEENTFDNLNEVPESIEVKNRSIKFLFDKKLTLIFSLLIGIIFTVISIISYNERQSRFNNPRKYLNTEYYTLYDKVKNGESISSKNTVYMNVLTGDIFLIRTDYNYYTDQNESELSNASFYYATNEAKSLIFGVDYTIEEVNDDVMFTLDYRGGFTDYLRGKFTVLVDDVYYECDLYYKINKGLYIKNVSKNKELLITKFNEYQNNFITAMDEYYISNTSYTMNDYFKLILPKTFEFSKSTVLLFYAYLIGTIISIISYFVFIVSILTYISDKLKYKESKYNEDIEKDKLVITKNKYFTPFIKEGYIKIICFVLLTISNFSLLFYYSRFLNRLNFDVPLDIDTLKKISNITRIGSLGLVVVTSKAYSRGKNAYIRTSLFLLIGLMFYAFEYFFLKRIFESNILISNFTSYIPSNFFLAIFLLIAISLFLFKTPKHVDSKTKLIIYRSLSIIPVLLFFGSYTLKVLDIKNIISLPLYIELLIPQKLVGIELFGVLFLYSMFVYEEIIKHKHGIGYLKQYKYTNKYYWIENIIICVLLLIITGIEYIPSLAESLKHIGVGKLKYTYLLLILFAFYHPRIEKPNTALNILYGSSFIISIVIPYLLLGYEVMYFIML